MFIFSSRFQLSTPCSSDFFFFFGSATEAKNMMERKGVIFVFVFVFVFVLSSVDLSCYMWVILDLDYMNHTVHLYTTVR